MAAGVQGWSVAAALQVEMREGRGGRGGEGGVLPFFTSRKIEGGTRGREVVVESPTP